MIFKNGLEDTSSPTAMTKLLGKLFIGELIGKVYTELLLKIMKGCKRGPLRLMGLLPIGTAVAHKTGTLTGYISDVGIITLPYESGNFAISVYIKNSPNPLDTNERIIAEISRMLYDYFLLN